MKNFFFNQKRLLIKKNLFLLNEVVAEIVYVLIKVYNIEKQEVCRALHDLIILDNIDLQSKEIMLTAIEIFSNNSMDFVDSILCAYSDIEKAQVASFDSKVNKYIG